MVEKLIIITNNELSRDNFKEKHELVFVDGSLMDVLIRVRDNIHIGHRLLTHPLMGSVKPNETPFKTVCISKIKESCVDFQSLSLIENSIETARNLIRNKPMRNWNDRIRDDFRLIDYDLIKNAIEK